MKTRLQITVMWILLPVAAIILSIQWIFTGKYSTVWYVEKIEELQERL
jgi:hypothetical protein